MIIENLKSWVKKNEDRMKRILIELSDFFFYMRVKNLPLSLHSLRPNNYQKWKQAIVARHVWIPL